MSDNDSEIKDYEIKKKKSLLWPILHVIFAIICVLIYLFLSASIVFLITTDKTDKTDKTDTIHSIFPNDCRGAPYGTKTVSPCNTPFLFEVVAQVFCPSMEYRKKSSRIQGEKNSKVKWPYNLFKDYNGMDYEKLIDWYLASMINAKTRVHNNIISTLKIFDIIPESILLFFSLPVASWLVHFIFFILILLYLSYYQIRDSFKLRDPFAIMIAIFTSIPIFLFNILLTSFFTTKLMFDLTIKPLILAWNEVLTILQENKTLIGYLFGLIFIIMLVRTDFSDFNIKKDISDPVKLVPTLLFIAIVGIHCAIWIYNFFFNIKPYKKVEIEMAAAAPLIHTNSN